MGPGVTFPLALVICLGSLLVALAATLYIRFSGPVATARELKDLRAEVRTLHGQLESVGLRWEQYREGVDGLLEELQATEERVERGRRKTQMAANRLERKNKQPEIDPDSREALVHRARALGHMV